MFRIAGDDEKLPGMKERRNAMLAQKPPMGWNSWNTFGENISEQLIMEMADVMVDEGYLAAGYEYLVIDDCWSLRQRGEDGKLVPDPAKFPHGMKYVADYVHSRGLKFGMYSCAGVMTCAGYPSSYDHEFTDAKTFAEWGVDYLKYDYCNFPENADCKNRYQTMSMALKASGREILFSACNWGKEDCWNWMRARGAHMYRSTGDIFDNFRSFTEIFKSQLDHFSQSAPCCFNDIDMLTVGMYNQGNVAIGKTCTDEEYVMQFALWCLAGAPLMLGADLRKMNPTMKALVQNPALIAIDQDPECRPPFAIRKDTCYDEFINNDDAETPCTGEIHGRIFTLFKHLADNEFAIAFVNLHSREWPVDCIFADLGLPVSSGIGLEFTDLVTGENLGVKKDYFVQKIPAHEIRIYRCKFAV